MGWALIGVSHKYKGSIILMILPLFLVSMITEQDLYLKILAYGLTDDASIAPPNVDVVNWYKFYSFCESQAILGIGLQCIDKLKKNLGISLKISQDLLLEWIGITEQIKAQNQILNKRTKELTEYLANKGKRSCILKGQGNALMYSKPLLRTPGDIDVWLEGSKKEIVEFVHKDYPKINVEYHHMQYPVFDDVEVEVHYYPSFCYNKWHNHRLLQYFKKESEIQFDNSTGLGFNAPTVPFNLVFQLSHMMRHFFTQGIGLRHAVDYYYLLKQDITEKEMQEVIYIMKRCGMYKFFQAIIWIVKEILGLNQNIKAVGPHAQAGKLILREMLRGGNFGHQYNNIGNTAFTTYARQMSYNMQYIVEFPSEPLSRPFALAWDYFHKRVVRDYYS